MRSLRLIAPMAIVVLLAAVLAGQDTRRATESAAPKPKAVRVAEVAPATESPALWFPGVSRAARRARLAFSIAGRLLERPVGEGERIAKGQVVARLDVREQTLGARAAVAGVAEARVRHAEARRDLERVMRLVEQGAATREELESLESLVEAAAAAADAAQARRAEAEREEAEGVLRSPFSGTVTEVFLEPGEHAAAGRPVIELAGEDGVEALLDVPEAIAVHLEQGADVEVRSAMRAARFGAGRIVTIGRAGGAAGRLFPVVVALGADVPVGISVEIALRAGDTATLTVPVEAVVDPAGVGPAVFRLRRSDGGVTAERVAVSVGALTSGRVAVDGGLLLGDEVIVAGQRGLLDGDAVEVVQ